MLPPGVSGRVVRVREPAALDSERHSEGEHPLRTQLRRQEVAAVVRSRNLPPQTSGSSSRSTAAPPLYDLGLLGECEAFTDGTRKLAFLQLEILTV